ncbi:MAG: tetratricopeptide repeat protein [Candidatus Electrothrix aestuarii]|uniref:Tetratricopeptide repeat protein n=1 Tax=Candidatus Electrothrix aestuarii TaxID=3062594 RepID=A0AAU8LYH1_9BACT|nr:tetratricopeptide repeat protein [Candidatus Electrothrix aestuarii]
MSQYTVQLSPKAFTQRLVVQKKKFTQAVTTAMEQHDESKRERLQLMVVSLTESLTFIKQGYKQEVTCRKGALMALNKMQKMLGPALYKRAAESVCVKDSTLDAEQILDKVIGKGGKGGAFAAFHSGRLAECRMDFPRAMVRFDKAVELDGANPHYLQAAGLLARKMYQHKKSLIRFMALEKLLVRMGKDSVELAIARREVAYSAALFSQHAQADAYYKKAIASLTKLAGKDHPEMGICWYQVGLLKESQGLYEEAEEPYKKALTIMGKAGDDITLAGILDKLARLHMELEGEPDAIPLFERLLKIKKNSPAPDLAGIIIICNNIGEAYRICGKYEESEKYYKQALIVTQKLRGKAHPAVGSIYQELAKLCERQRKPDEVKKYNEMAAAIFQRVLEEQEAAAGGDNEGRLTL